MAKKTEWGKALATATIWLVGLIMFVLSIPTIVLPCFVLIACLGATSFIWKGNDD